MPKLKGKTLMTNRRTLQMAIIVSIIVVTAVVALIYWALSRTEELNIAILNPWEKRSDWYWIAAKVYRQNKILLIGAGMVVPITGYLWMQYSAIRAGVAHKIGIQIAIAIIFAGLIRIVQMVADKQESKEHFCREIATIIEDIDELENKTTDLTQTEDDQLSGYKKQLERWVAYEKGKGVGERSNGVRTR